MSDAPPPAAVIDEEIFDGMYRLSQRYHSHGLYGPAVGLLEFLLRHAPLRAGFHFALGKALHGQAAHVKAVLSYRRAITLGLPDVDVHLYLGQCLIFLERFAEAEAALRQFVDLARARSSRGVMGQQEQRARHLLDHIVTPRLQVGAGVSVPSGAVGTPSARTRSSRGRSMENTL